MSLIPLFIVQSELDNPDNPYSFRAIANGTAPNAADARLDILEPLLARTGLLDELTTSSASIVTARAAGAGTAVSGSGAGSHRGEDASPRPASVLTELCSPESVGSDAGLLDYCMDQAWDVVFRIHGASGTVLNKLSAASGAVGIVPGLGEAGAVGGFATWLVTNERERNAALLPSVLTSLTIQPTPTEFLEDDDATGDWTPAMLTASNLGWDFGLEALTAVFQGLQLAAAFDKFDLEGPVTSDAAGAIAQDPVTSELIKRAAPEDYRLPPQTYGPVNVSDEQWSMASVPVGDAIVLSSHTEYEAHLEGTSVLSVRTADGEFGSQQTATQATVKVKPIQMSISPSDVTLAPGEVQTFTIKVVDAKYPDRVEVDAAVPLQGAAGPAEFLADNLSTVTYTAPENPDAAHPDLLTVRYSGTTGARAAPIEERNAIATIRFGRITISPQPPVDPRRTIGDLHGRCRRPIGQDGHVVRGRRHHQSVDG